VRIAVDAMGGDHQPAAPVQGALEALQARADLEVLLVGQPEAIAPHLAGAPPRLRRRVHVVEAPEVIGPEERPAWAVREKPRSSIVVGLELCRRGEADAFVSAGNTGALTVASVRVLDRIPGVDRPAMPAVLPTVDGRGIVLLDVGATTDADARNLYDFAVMGSLFAERARGVARPRVALLNVGTEEGKGTAAAKQAFALLQASHLNFVGNIEGRDLFADRADVVVTGGFVGNIVLKALEGFGLGVSQVLGRELRHSGLLTLLGAALAARTLRRLKRRMDYAEQGGTPFLGVGGVCVKCHGSSGPRALRNGVLTAARVVEGGVVREIARSLGEQPQPPAPADGRVAPAPRAASGTAEGAGAGA
jgi:glycerol-3-phosphate acyltransferase PlsX